MLKIYEELKQMRQKCFVGMYDAKVHDRHCTDARNAMRKRNPM